MDLDNFIIVKTKERRGEERGDLAKKSTCCFQNIEDRKGGNKKRRGEIWQKKAGAASQKKQHDNVRTSYA